MAVKNAIQEYREADKTFLAMGLCWEKETMEKLRKVQKMAGE